MPNETPYVLWQEHINRYAFAAEFVKDKNILDVACGTGYGSAYLAESGAKEVVGGDISKEAITYARKNVCNDKLNFALLDARQLPFPTGTLDVITSFETIEHLEKYMTFLAECKRILKSGGILICSTPNKKLTSPHTPKPLNPFHVREFYPMEYYKLITSYFSDVSLYGQHYFSLIRRIKSKALGVGGKVLSLVPEGNKIKTLIHKSTNSSPNMSKIGTENSRVMLNRNYCIAPFQDGLFKTPLYIVAVAKKT
ncbi:MAG: class I SAM-dependent methyltransferase [Tenericutes bacterium]|nr:class I SAM-dependent methyltransferase [Mycoplasmatota bacterium]